MSVIFHVITLVSFILALPESDAKVMVLEAESIRESYTEFFRSKASGTKTIRLYAKNEIEFKFCLIRTTTVFLQDIIFSNSGGADLCNVSLNGNFLGSFKSERTNDGGKSWNEFDSSGTLGTSLQLKVGWHILSLKVVEADIYGIELDAIQVTVSDDELNMDILSCKLQCIEEDPEVTAPEDLAAGKAVQRSYPTLCAEEDNVNVAIFNSQVKEFEITATLPIYRSFANLRKEDETNCPFITPVYWQFENVTVEPTSKKQAYGNSTLYIKNKSTYHMYKTIKMEVTFILRGNRLGHLDSEIGSVLFMDMKPPEADVEVRVSYKHKNKTTVELPMETFTSTDTSRMWNISDFTWIEDKPNYLFITTRSTAANLELLDLRMERRYMKPETAFKIYDDHSIIFEVVNVDFFWQNAKPMELVQPSTGKSWKDVGYFRIYYSQPSAAGFSQIFVLYQDGNMRLLNPTPPGLDWTPFGTSVIIGQTNVDDFRPALTIAKVEIEPADMIMDLTYDDGSKASLRLVPDLDRSTLYVTNLDFKKDTIQHPFATFRSMYVQTGNDDSDHLVSDQSESKRILGGTWSEMIGTTFFLYRRCESKHLTLSPDIKLTITKT